MARRTGLGRGLDALIPGSERPTPTGAIALPINKIKPNPRQPRAHFDEKELADLTGSIREHGILQPLIVSYDETQDLYTLIAGERRLLAAGKAGLETVPALIRDVTEQQRLELALIENLQRADLNPLESAEAYRQLAEDFSLSHEEISARVGKSRTAITNTLRLLRLPTSIQQALNENRITEGHARALLALPTSQAQTAALQTILSHELNVRQTEDLVRRLSGEKTVRLPRPTPPPEISDLENQLRSHLGTRVSVNRRGKGGSVVIHYYSDEELDALVKRIMGNE